MGIHIGDIIYRLKEELKIDNKDVAEVISVQPTSIFKIYKKESIDPEKVAALSKFFNLNLFDYYFDQETLKSFKNNPVSELENKVFNLEKTIIEHENIVSNLTLRMKEKDEVINLLKDKIKILTEKLDSKI